MIGINKNEPNFSVLIPLYFKEKPEYFDRALKSIYFDQILKPTEIVIVEDGPLTEQLDNIVKTYLEKLPNILKIVKLEKNKGLGTALNIGVKNCSYEIIARMDSDDISLPERFEKQLALMKTGKYDLIGSNIFEFEGDENKIIAIKKVPENMEEILKYSRTKNPINHMSVMFNKYSVLRAGNYLPFYGFEDYYLWVRMLINGMVFYNIQEPLLKVRGGKEMIKRRGGSKILRAEIKFFNKLNKIGFISKFELIKILVIRTIISMIPNSWRGAFYRCFLRKSL